MIIRQYGSSLITAVFLITALAFLAILMTRMTIHGSTISINELFSSRALLAAESGIDWAIYDILNNGNNGETGTSVALEAGQNIWFATTVTSWKIDEGSTNERIYYEITSKGMAGGTSVNPTVQRTLTIQFMP